MMSTLDYSEKMKPVHCKLLDTAGQLIEIMKLREFSRLRSLCPPNRRWGTYCFWCGSRRRRRRRRRPRRRPRPRSFFLTRYLLNQWMDFDQTCIDTWLGGGKELIRFW